MKFERGSRMWVDPKGVEQATAEPVAKHKASRFRCELVVDLCAGIGSDTLALAARSNVLAVDLDQGCAGGSCTTPSVHGVSDRVLPIRARAERFAIPAGAWLHLDPDRRASSSRRASRLVDYARARSSGTRSSSESPPARSSSARPLTSRRTSPARTWKSS